MGLARKYLPPSVIAQLAPLSSSEISAYGGDVNFSLATRRYLFQHGLVPPPTDGEFRCESTPMRTSEEHQRWLNCESGRGLCSVEVSNITPRWTVMESEEDSYLPCSQAFPLPTELEEVGKEERLEVDINYDAPILDLQHLRELPKLL